MMFSSSLSPSVLSAVHSLLEKALDDCLDNHTQPQPDAHELANAMRYAVLGGGKRLRPLLVLAAAHANCADALVQDANKDNSYKNLPAIAWDAACAVELMHAYSLVHDDMPCMDNDVLRRGKPTVHVKFGEATALLVGDALQALAFETISKNPQANAAMCRVLAQASGWRGMAGGQAIDLASVGGVLNLAQLQTMHRLKTGALLHASVMLGAMCAHTPMDAQAKSQLSVYGDAIGLAFQVMDDVLDVTQNSANLGKTAGKDADNNKPNFVALLGLFGAQECANKLVESALQALENSGLPNTELLQTLALQVTQRKH